MVQGDNGNGKLGSRTSIHGDLVSASHSKPAGVGDDMVHSGEDEVCRTVSSI